MGALQTPALATGGAVLVTGVTQLPSALGQLPLGERHSSGSRLRGQPDLQPLVPQSGWV